MLFARSRSPFCSFSSVSPLLFFSRAAVLLLLPSCSIPDLFCSCSFFFVFLPFNFLLFPFAFFSALFFLIHLFCFFSLSTCFNLSLQFHQFFSFSFSPPPSLLLYPISSSLKFSFHSQFHLHLKNVLLATASVRTRCHPRARLQSAPALAHD